MKRIFQLSALVLMSVLALSSCGTGSSTPEVGVVAPSIARGSAPNVIVSSERDYVYGLGEGPLKARAAGGQNVLGQGEVLWPCAMSQGIAGSRTCLKYEILYKLDSSLNGGDISEILKAVNKWNSMNTRVKFAQATTSYANISFKLLESTFPGYANTGGLSEYIGRNLNNVEQYVKVHRGAFDYATVLHELGHVIGLEHEQQRCDRNNYIYMQPVYTQSKICITHPISYQSSYDHYSMMHYPNTFYSGGALGYKWSPWPLASSKPDFPTGAVPYGYYDAANINNYFGQVYFNLGTADETTVSSTDIAVINAMYPSACDTRRSQDYYNQLGC